MSADFIFEGYNEVGLFLGCPVAGLEAVYLLDSSVSKASRNFAPRKPSGSVVGNLVFDGDAPPQFDGLVNFVQTDTGENPEHTIFSVIRNEDTSADDATRSMFYGTFQSPAMAGGGNTYGTSLYMSAAGGLTVGAGRGTDISNDTTAPSPQIPAFPRDQWHLVVDTVNAVSSSLYDLTTGQSNTIAAAIPRFLSAGKYRIGSGYSQFGGLCRVASWWYFPRALSGSERDKMAVVIREREARHGRIV